MTLHEALAAYREASVALNRQDRTTFEGSVAWLTAVDREREARLALLAAALEVE